MKKSILSPLIIVLFTVLRISAQEIPYGNNPKAGNYFDAGDINLYYETYGTGTPILMLHGGVYGYIDEFEFLIPKLAEDHQVICLATRGHGKSEVGDEPYTWKQRAEDAYKILQHLQIDSALVLGFSDGGSAAFKFAAMYPEMVIKVIAMGVGFTPDKGQKTKYHYSSSELLEESGEYFESRLKLMPDPDLWDKSLQMLNSLYNDDAINVQTLEGIRCPVLLMNGELDQYQSVDALIRAYKIIPHANLSVIPNCGHVILYCNFPAVWESMKKFIE